MQIGKSIVVCRSLGCNICSTFRSSEREREENIKCAACEMTARRITHSSSLGLMHRSAAAAQRAESAYFLPLICELGAEFPKAAAQIND